MNVDQKIIRFIKLTGKNRKQKGNKCQETEKFEITEGVRQRDPLSSLLFSIHLENIMLKEI